jgi:Cu-processing system permease protein
MFHRVFLIARTVWLEFLRRKDFYVVMILVGLFMIGMVVIRIIGVENPATARFLMSLGLLLSYVLAAILTATVAARQLPNEMEKRTLLPLLARPVSRAEVILGKSLAVATVACSSLMLFLLLSWAPVPRLPDQRFFAFVQMGVLRMVGLCVLGIYTIALSLFVPGVVAVLISLATFFAAPTIVNFAAQLVANSWRLGGKVVERALAIVPDFSLFEHSQRYVEGASPMTMPAVLAVLGYGIIFAAFFYFLTVWRFNRRPL